MSFLPIPMSTGATARRRFIGRTGGLVLSGAAVALIAGNDALAADAGAANSADIQILNAAIASEHEAIAAYQWSADSHLLTKPVQDVALAFQGHHQAHVALLSSTVEKLGGKPVAAKSDYHFMVDQLQSELDILKFAAKLEQGAVSQYLAAIPQFGSRDLSRAAASILGDEAMHWAALRQAMGQFPVPSAFMT